MDETAHRPAAPVLVLVGAIILWVSSATAADAPCCASAGPGALCTSTQSMQVIPDPFIPQEEDGTPRMVLAVQVHVCDRTDADKVSVSDSRTVLVDAHGAIAARLAYLPDYDGGTAWPVNPREFSAQLLFTVPPPDVQAVWLRVVARRYRLLPISLEWTGGNGDLALPLRGGADGVTVVVERIEVAGTEGSVDLGDEVRNAGDHLQIALRGEAVISDVAAPHADWARLGMEAVPTPQVIRPDYVHTVVRRTRLDGGLYREDTEAMYHFLGLREVPAVASLTLQVQRWVPLEEHWSELP